MSNEEEPAIAPIAEIDATGRRNGRTWNLPVFAIEELFAVPSQDLVVWNVRIAYYEEVSQGSYAFINTKQRQVEGRAMWLINCPVLGLTLVRSHATNGSALQLIGPNGMGAAFSQDHADRIIGRVVATVAKTGGASDARD